MSFQQKIRSTAIRATAAVIFVEVTTHLPSEGRSSLTYHYLFDHLITPWSRRLFDPEGAHHLALDVVRKGLAPRLSHEGRCDDCRVNMKVEIGGGCGSSNNGKIRKLQFPGPIGCKYVVCIISCLPMTIYITCIRVSMILYITYIRVYDDCIHIFLYYIYKYCTLTFGKCIICSHCHLSS